MKFFVIADNGIGDSIMMLPALRALAMEVSSEIKILSNPRYFDNVLYEFTKKSILLNDYNNDNQHILTCIEETDIVVIYSTWDIVNQLGIKPFLKDKIVFGYFSEYCTNLIEYDHRNMIDQYFSVVMFFNKAIDVNRYSYPLVLPDSSKVNASALYSAFSPGTLLIGIHTHTREEKMVSADYFVEVIKIVKEIYPQSILIVVDPVDTELSVMLDKNTFVNLQGLDISIVMQFFQYISLLICIDSCILHAADLIKLPIISFFPATSVNNWGPKYSRSLVIDGRNLSIKEIRSRGCEITSFLKSSLADK